MGQHTFSLDCVCLLFSLNICISAFPSLLISISITSHHLFRRCFPPGQHSPYRCFRRSIGRDPSSARLALEALSFKAKHTVLSSRPFRSTAVRTSYGHTGCSFRICPLSRNRLQFLKPSTQTSSLFLSRLQNRMTPNSYRK